MRGKQAGCGVCRLYFFCLVVVSQLLHGCSNKSLTLLEIIQLQSPKFETFDLSGAHRYDDSTLLIISDDEDGIFKLKKGSNTIEDFIKIVNDKYYDLEAIVICRNEILVSGEYQHSMIYKLGSDNTLHALDIQYLKDAQSTKWGNMGIEGLAFDSTTNILYFVKERKPKTLFKMNLDTQQVSIIPLAGPLEDKGLNNDISDLAFERRDGKSFLYILQRRDCSIARLDLNSGHVAIKSFAKFVRDKKGFQSLYANTREERKYGIGEALVLFTDEIWIGVDNNDNKINLYNKLADKYSLDGAMPIFFKFKRNDF